MTQNVRSKIMETKKTKTGRPEGRPTKYDPVFVDKVEEYLAMCNDVEDEFHKTRGDRSDTFERTLKVHLPKIEEFAIFLKVHKDTLAEWAKEHVEFSAALNKIKMEQHNRLVDESLAGNYNPVIAKLMLSSNHGYREKSDMTSNDESIKIVFDNAFTRKTERGSK